MVLLVFEAPDFYQQRFSCRGRNGMLGPAVASGFFLAGFEQTTMVKADSARA